MPGWIIASIVLSVVATIVINVIARLIPTSQERVDTALRKGLDPPSPGGPRVKVWFPWKWMIGLSVAASLVLNLFGRR